MRVLLLVLSGPWPRGLELDKRHITGFYADFDLEKNMKILYGITRTEPGGAQTHLLSLLSAGRVAGEVELMCGKADLENGTDALVSQAKSMGIPVHIIPSLVHPLSPLQDLKALLEMIGIIRRIRPDLIHLHSSKAGLLGRIASAVVRCPAIFTAHGWAFTDGVSAKRKLLAVLLERLVAPFSARIIAVSEYDAALARRWGVGHAQQVVIIHNGIPVDAPVHLNESEAGRRTRVLMAARFALPKAQEELIHAVAEIPDLEAWLIGDGPQLESARNLVLQKGLQDRVCFFGRRIDVPDLIAQADIFALISNYEGFPISTLEGMRAGIPTVVSDVGGAGEAVLHGITGYIVPQGDRLALVNALKRLTDDAGHRRILGEAARARFLAHYTSPLMIKKLDAIYQQVVH